MFPKLLQTSLEVSVLLTFPLVVFFIFSFVLLVLFWREQTLYGTINHQIRTFFISLIFQCEEQKHFSSKENPLAEYFVKKNAKKNALLIRFKIHVVQFYRGLKFIFHCFKLIIIQYHTQEQWKIKFKPRMKLNHNTDTHSQVC